LFNILGPLTNPAGARNQVMGVFHPDLVGIQARVLQRLGSRHVMVVHGTEGLDEISLSGDTLIGELRDNDVREYVVNPRAFGLDAAPLDAIRVASGEESKDMLLAALSKVPSPARDIVALNAGAAIYVGGLADSHQGGVQKAIEVTASGAARAKLDEFVNVTQGFKV
jgi:anthranilate phosphoribosyltransferase